MKTEYQTDVIVWANKQAALLRAGNLSALDIEHIAEEIEDVGKSEQRELASRMSVLLTHLLKWQFQPDRRGTSWQRTIKEQRRAIAAHIKQTPSLKVSLDNQNWFEGVWADAIAKSIEETGLELFPEDCAWSVEQILLADFFPD